MGIKKKVIENKEIPRKQVVFSVMKYEACSVCVHWEAYVKMIKTGNTSMDADVTFCKGCDVTGMLKEIKID